MIFGVRIIDVCMMIGSLEMIVVVQVERDLFGARLLGIIICKFKRREEHLPILFLKCRGSYKLLNNLDYVFRLSINLRMLYHRYEEIDSENLVQDFPEIR